MIKIAEKGKDVRNLKFHVAIEDPDLLGEAIRDIVSQRTSGNISDTGRGFKIPDMDDYEATVYSSSAILTNLGAAPQGDYIYTMDQVVFRSHIKTETEGGKARPKEVEIKVTGGWVLQNNEYVLVIFSLKEEQKTLVSDELYQSAYPKLQGRLLYNAVLTRYVTDNIGKHILENRNFSVRETENDYPDLTGTFNRNEKVSKVLRGVADVGNSEVDYDNPGGKKKSPTTSAPDAIKNNYFLYDKSAAVIGYGYKDPATPKISFNKKTDPGIEFKFNFPDSVTDEVVADTNNGVQYNKPSDKHNPGTVDVSFVNIPRNMPNEIFNSMYEYIKRGLNAKEMESGTNLTYGNKVFQKDPNKGEEDIYGTFAKKIMDLAKEIKDLKEENQEFKIDIDENYPSQFQAKGVRKNLLKYIGELEAYARDLKKKLPLPLDELERILAEKGEYAIRPKNINLLKILKKEQ